jgi:hypothetical protein
MAIDETQAVRKLVKIGLAKGYTVSVMDGEEWTLRRSTSLEDIMAAVMTTDEDQLAFRNQAGHGAVFYLVYGNSPEEVINDHTVSIMANEMYAEWEAWIERKVY